jgi:hypothetical protein
VSYIGMYVIVNASVVGLALGIVHLWTLKFPYIFLKFTKLQCMSWTTATDCAKFYTRTRFRTISVLMWGKEGGNEDSFKVQYYFMHVHIFFSSPPLRSACWGLMIIWVGLN